MEIFWISGSPYAWRALLTLEVKKIRYASRLLEASKGEHKAPELLTLNPRGKVPILKDGDVALSESLAIMAYLDRKTSEPALFGHSPPETGQIWRAISASLYYLEPVINRVVAPIFSGRTTEKSDDICAAAKEVHTELQTIERILHLRPWLATNVVSAADITLYPFTELLLRAAGKDAAQSLDLGFLPLAETYPAVASWQEQIRALPGYERTYPPHWRASTAYAGSRSPAPVA